eukprot:g4055.t1
MTSVDVDLPNFKVKLGTEANEIINKSFPDKIMQLTKLYESLKGIASESGVFSTEGVTSSALLFTKINFEIIDLCYILDSLELWLQLKIPKISDGGNFGVEIQEEVLAMLHNGKRSGMSVLDAITKYYFQRGHMLSELERYEGVLDFKQSVIELDKRQFAALCQSTCDLRNNYAILYDKLKKNGSKLIEPRDADGPPLMMY